MGKFAAGKFAYGISDRSGQRYKLNEMKREWTGMLVGPDEYEPKQPQLEPRRKVVDPEALKNPRPDRVEPLDVFVGVPLVETPTLRAPQAFSKVGVVAVNVPDGTVNVNVTGLSAAMSVGSASVVGNDTFDNTTSTLDSTAQTFDQG